MTDTVVYIGDEVFDLEDGSVLSQTLKRGSVGDIVTRSVSFTNTFKGPFTERNNRIYQHSNNDKSRSDIPYRKQKVRVVQGGVEVVSDGLHYLRKIDRFYEAYVLENVYGFFEAIGDNKLSQLNFDGLNGLWAQADKIAARLNTTGIVAPVIDTGNFDPDHPTLGNQMPDNTYLFSVYYHTIIDRIFIDAGYEKAGIVFSDEKYLKTIVPYSRPSYQYDEVFVNERRASAKVATPQSIPTPGGGTGTIVVFGETVIQDPKGFWNGTDRYIATDPDPAAAGHELFGYDMQVVLDITVTGGTVNFKIEGSSGESIGLTNIGTGVHTINSRDFSLGDIALLAQEGDDTTVRISSNSGTPSVTVNSGSVVFTPLGFVGRYVYFNYLLPDMKQKDFIKDFLVCHGLIPSQKGNVITFKSWNEIISDKANAKDWTNKRVDSSINEMSFNALNYAQTNYFRYASKGDSFEHEGGINVQINKDLGLGQFEVDNENIGITKTVYQSAFNNTLTELLGGIMMARIPAIMISGTEFENDPGFRKCLVRNKYSFEPDVAYGSSSQSTYLVAYFESPDETLTMSFEQYLEDWYSMFIQSLQRGKLITRMYNLTHVDIAGVDFFKLIYDDGSYFILNEVKNFVPGIVTEVELFKVI